MTAEVRREQFKSETSTVRQSIVPTLGKEGKFIDKDCYAGKTIAVFTSGGDAQGMIIVNGRSMFHDRSIHLGIAIPVITH